ncbi:MAG TPA: hypothetical protein VFE98_04620 [Candidatus Bathyarchaeia archaeon]|nr:hypothetical protein [Candidatus Bathyarchaeia archaeon]
MEKTKGELIGEFHNKMVTTTVKELSPEGVRMEVNMEGEIKGKDFVRMRWLLDSLNEFCE